MKTQIEKQIEHAVAASKVSRSIKELNEKVSTLMWSTACIPQAELELGIIKIIESMERVNSFESNAIAAVARKGLAQSKGSNSSLATLYSWVGMVKLGWV